jgi:phage terminase large subunit
MEIKATKVLEKLLSSEKRFILSVGSSRSSKTYSVYQYVLLYCIQHKGEGKWISMIRRSFPSLKRSLLREFIQFIDELGLYSAKIHNKSSQVIELYGNYVEFFSLDNFEKVKGSKRDVAYLNEITEIDYEPANQVFLRTTEKIIMDMNPSDTFHWVWDMRNREDVDYIHSTYKDNPFLEPDVVRQIESYKEVDENYWRIYGLGLPGISTTTIYSHWKTYKEHELKEKHIINECYGLDIGYNHKTCLVRLREGEDGLYFNEEIYSSGLTTGDLLDLITSKGLRDNIFCDSARPDIIEDLRRRRLLAKGAEKAVKEGILYLKSKPIYIEENSTNLLEEIKHYRWKSAGEVILDEPIKLNDDGMDAMRYAAYSSRKKQSVGVPFYTTTNEQKRYFR